MASKRLAALAILVAGAVVLFAIYTFGWHESRSRHKPHPGLLAPVPYTSETGGYRLYKIRPGDVVRFPGTATDCVATGEGGMPQLFCAHTRTSRFEVTLDRYGAALYDLARHGEPMVPTYYVPAEMKLSRMTSVIQKCAPPRGPGDRSVHSTNLRVKNISCRVGRHVALACTRFTYGHSGICAAVGYHWRCTSTNPPGSESAQRCAAGSKLMSILWLD